MSGILANSATITMVAGDTSADNTLGGYLATEPITLSLTDAPTSARWSLSRPSAATGSSRLNDANSLTPSFTPDVEGYYVLSCVVNGATSYVMRLGVVQLAHVSTLSAIRFMPVAEASVPTPALGRTLFCSAEQDTLAVKLPDGSVQVL